MNGLPVREPLGPDQLAALGWMADPLLRPLPTPTARVVPDNLAWLAVRGAARTSRERGRHRAERIHDLVGGVPRSGARPEGVSSYDDRALMAVGRVDSGWSFAFDGDPAPFNRQRLVSPAAAASTVTRAVVVWSGPRTWHGELPRFDRGDQLAGRLVMHNARGPALDRPSRSEESWTGTAQRTEDGQQAETGLRLLLTTQRRAVRPFSQRLQSSQAGTKFHQTSAPVSAMGLSWSIVVAVERRVQMVAEIPAGDAVRIT